MLYVAQTSHAQVREFDRTLNTLLRRCPQQFAAQAHKSGWAIWIRARRSCLRVQPADLTSSRPIRLPSVSNEAAMNLYGNIRAVMKSEAHPRRERSFADRFSTRLALRSFLYLRHRAARFYWFLRHRIGCTISSALMHGNS